MLFTDEENLTYIPVSSFIILLVILLTCASRRRKMDAFAAVEQNMGSDIKGDYAIMCFPCLKKKPELKEFEQMTDLSDQFEYIVEKYTIRKVPLLLANTAEDIIERQEELELTRTPQSQPQLVKDEFINFQVSQEVYNVQKVPPCITVAAHTVCPGRKSIKERPKPSDVLESMSPLPKPMSKNPNYVVIPTKGSVRNKDIMMTKREITNQYLNNFSSVFVDNLKDQVPKDPECFPSLSRPYTSALRNYPIPEKSKEKTVENPRKKSRKSKSHKVAYAFPAEETAGFKDETLEKKEPFYDSDSGQEQTTDQAESECQEDNENDTPDLTDKSKSLLVLNDSDSTKEGMDCAANPFKTTVKSSASEIDNNQMSSADPEYQSAGYLPHGEDWPNSKNVTYEDIQALDVGYEFTSCEKLGVKPKMTRIHYPNDSERLKESLKQLALGDSKISKRCFSAQDQTAGNPTPKSARTIAKPRQIVKTNEFGLYPGNFVPPLEKLSSKSILTETSFLPTKRKSVLESAEPVTGKSLNQDQTSTTTFTSKSEESKSPSLHDLDTNVTATMEDSVAEISKLYELTAPVTPRATECSSFGQEVKDPEELANRFPAPSKSRSFHEAGRFGMRRETASEAKGKDYLPYPDLYPTKKTNTRLDEIETETSCSLYSRESKTSSAVTSPRSSEPDEGKRATLRWKIVIKHHREDDSSRKNVNVNIKN